MRSMYAFVWQLHVFLCLRISVSRVLETMLRGMVALEPVTCCV